MNNHQIDVLHQQGATTSVKCIVGCPDVDCFLYNPGTEIMRVRQHSNIEINLMSSDHACSALILINSNVLSGQYMMLNN